jgi:lysophospholipase L1-like esterase
VRRDTSVQVVARLAAEAAPRVVPDADCRLVLSFGANDATWEDGRVRSEPEASVRALRAALAHGLPAFVVGPPPVADEAHTERIAALSARFARECAGSGVPYVEIVDELRRGGPWQAEVRAGDGAHPAAGGYAQLAALVAAPLRAWLDRT